MREQNEKILAVRNLKTYFFTEDGTGKAVDGIDFSLHKNETFGLVGESGCGKSITSLSILRLIPNPPGKIVDGEILFKGQDLLKISEAELRSIRGNKISMIFQEPMTSLNPVYSVGEQIAEVFRLHFKLGYREAWQKSVEILKLVDIPSPEKRASQHPYELSGGMRQRVMIAMALACHPDILIADEPTTALDVTIQAQILDIMKSLQKEFGMGIILITHDLGVVSQMCDQVAVMYAGRIVEHTATAELFQNPKHPYTIGLLNSLPLLHQTQTMLKAIPGNVPSPFELPAGCSFAPRCQYATDLCRRALPELRKIGSNSQVRCWIYSPEWQGSNELRSKVGIGHAN